MSASTMAGPLLDVTDISVRFGGLVAVDTVSLNIEPGTIHGLIGPNGAGKTTFFNVVTGLIRQSSGRIRFKGQDITNTAAHRRAALGMRRSFQSVQLVANLTGLENILIGLHDELFPKGPKGIWRLFAGESVDRAGIEKAHRVAALLGIEHTLDRPVAEISFADQRFVEIARCLVADPAILMLDEPAAGLAEPDIRRLDELMRRLATETGLAILLVEHVLSLVLGVSEEITVLENGRLITRGTPQEVAADPRVKAAYLGEEADA